MTRAEKQTLDKEVANARFREACATVAPETFIVLGSGLDSFVDRLEVSARLPFSAVDGLARSTAPGHVGEFVVGQVRSRSVLLSVGRLHRYEGHPWSVVTRPIEFAAQLGVREAILTNAAGGIREDLEPGRVMLICDHIEWNQPYPWRNSPGPSPYDESLLERMVDAGLMIDLILIPGIYAAVSGPSYETPAEIRALREVGADAVGMSTSREIRAGVQVGLRCAALSFITNRAAGLGDQTLNHSEVLEVGKRAGQIVGDLLEASLRLRA